jgi:hypothetical protein
MIRFFMAGFRARSPQGPMPTHHTAFDRICELKAAAPSQDFYVAECDIMGFYDSVDHQVALQSFHQLSERVQAVMPDRVIDLFAENVFRAFLNCYSFPQNVLREAEPYLKRLEPDGYFPWPAEMN